VQFLRPTASSRGRKTGTIEWLDDNQVAPGSPPDRRPTACRPRFHRPVSLAGRSKTALYFDGDDGDSDAGGATTHILKPAIAGLDDHYLTSTSASTPPPGRFS